jgi:hypothetical protein
MRGWVKLTIGAGALVLACMLALGGTAGYFVFRSLERSGGTEAAAAAEIDRVRARFGTRAPLVEISDPRRMDVRINRDAGAAAGTVTTLHVVSWNAEDAEIVRLELPLWLMRFSSVNLLSRVGALPDNFRLTVDDVERYGPGVVVDYKQSGSTRVFLWVD